MPAEAAIVIPDEWAKPYEDFFRFVLTGLEITPYVSTFGKYFGSNIARDSICPQGCVLIAPQGFERLLVHR
jgi:hypothetical protein